MNVKPFPLAIAILFFWSFSAKSQNINGGFTLGTNFAQVDGDQYGGYNKLGLNAGMYVYVPLKNESKLQLEILFSQKGSKKRIDPEAVVAQNTFKLSYNYIDVPLLYVRKIGPVEAHVGSGININVKAERDDNGIISDDDKLNTFEIPFHLGASYAITENSKVFLRHSYSLFRAGNPYNGGTYLFTQNGLYNRLFTLGFRYGL